MVRYILPLCDICNILHIKMSVSSMKWRPQSWINPIARRQLEKSTCEEAFSEKRIGIAEKSLTA